VQEIAASIAEVSSKPEQLGHAGSSSTSPLLSCKGCKNITIDQYSKPPESKLKG
jgi:hypothetical protein